MTYKIDEQKRSVALDVFVGDRSVTLATCHKFQDFRLLVQVFIVKLIKKVNT